MKRLPVGEPTPLKLATPRETRTAEIGRFENGKAKEYFARNAIKDIRQTTGHHLGMFAVTRSRVGEVPECMGTWISTLRKKFADPDDAFQNHRILLRCDPFSIRHSVRLDPIVLR